MQGYQEQKGYQVITTQTEESLQRRRDFALTAAYNFVGRQLILVETGKQRTRREALEMDGEITSLAKAYQV